MLLVVQDMIPVHTMASLRDVQSWMHWYGWSNRGGPGAVNTHKGKIYGYHGDALWEADVQRATEIQDRLDDRPWNRPWGTDLEEIKED